MTDEITSTPTEESGPADATPDDVAPAEGERPGLGKAEPTEGLNEEAVGRAIEALLLVAETPVAVRQLARVMRRRSAEVRPILERLIGEYADRGIQIVEVAGGYQFRTHPEARTQVGKFLAQRPARMSRAQMETLSIVAYRQPVTRPEIDDIRGVDAGSTLKGLADRGFVKILGRKDEPGRPLLYGTTEFFLEFFGLKALRDLPTLTEFSELSDESKDIFERRTGEAPDLRAVADRAREEEAQQEEARRAAAPEGDDEDEDEGSQELDEPGVQPEIDPEADPDASDAEV